jgi:hypothetical protein
MRSSEHKSATRKPIPPKKTATVGVEESIKHLRSQAHDLSNALEAILQACYLLGQSKLDENSRRWLQLIDSSSQDAARINREIRKSLRVLSGE